ncbi:hypothetical protein ACIQ9Q_29470 [Streptomyces sp. NPDC094438]|uniref:hypothetical protein n=1 Tax=Streptomyces sp. NPDC094438 TaxID=3366061 RepID=UPI0037FCFA93
MPTLWRTVLAALTDPTAVDRDQVLALGAADLALNQDSAASSGDVQDIALAEFGVVLGPRAAAAALTARRAHRSR